VQQRGRVSSPIHFVTMNTFANRFSTTSAVSELRKAQALAVDNDEFSDSMWGSEAGFGSLAKGVPTFSVPAVADVRTSLLGLFIIFFELYALDVAHLIFETTHRRPGRPKLRNQNTARNHYTCF
jgi:hypothetical protein